MNYLTFPFNWLGCKFENFPSQKRHRLDGCFPSHSSVNWKPYLQPLIRTTKKKLEETPSRIFIFYFSFSIYCQRRTRKKIPFCFNNQYSEHYNGRFFASITLHFLLVIFTFTWLMFDQKSYYSALHLFLFFTSRVCLLVLCLMHILLELQLVSFIV